MNNPNIFLSRKNQSDEIKDLATALCKAQGELRGAKKDATNPFFKSHYATLESVFDAIRDPLAKNGLSVIQPTELMDGVTVVRTILIHSSGQWIDGIYPVVTAKNDPQGLGSAISYARRYSLMSMVGIPAMDDDAEAATARTASNVAPRSTTQSPPHVSMPNNIISEAQRKRMYAIWKKSGWQESDVKMLLQSFGYAESKEVKWKDYDAICAALSNKNDEHFDFEKEGAAS